MLLEDDPTSTLLALVGASVFKYGASLWMAQKPQEPQKVGEVAQLFVYPIKSCGGISVQSASCRRNGLCYEDVYDRHWVLATKNGTYIDQLMAPKLALVTPSIHGDVIECNAPGMRTLRMPTNPKMDDRNTKQIGNGPTAMQALDCGDEAAAWFEAYTGRNGARLYHSALNMEKRNTANIPRAWEHEGRTCDTLAFSNFCAYMLLGENSVEQLNTHLQSPVSFGNFRPSIMMKGGNGFEEDEFGHVKIGNATFSKLDKNARCRIVNVDQTTGKPGQEPFNTLRRVRTFPKYGKDNPCIGVYLGLDLPATVRVGDPIYATKLH